MYRFQQPPLVDAGAGTRGLMGVVAQIFAGAKTFQDLLTGTAGLVVNGDAFGTASILAAHDIVSFSGDLYGGTVYAAQAVEAVDGIFSGEVGAAVFRSGGGSGASVSFGPTGDPNTGFWFPAPDTVNWVTGGTLRAAMSATGQFSLAGISQLSMPTNTIFSIGGSTVYDSPSGTLNWAALHLFPVGSLAGPSISFAGDSDTGFWWQQSGGMVCSANGVRQWRTNGGTLLYLASDAVWIDLSNGGMANAFGSRLTLGNAVTTYLQGSMANGVAAVAVTLGSTVNYSNASSKLIVIANNLTEERAAFGTAGLADGFKLTAGAAAGSLSINNSVGVALTWNGVTTLTLDSNYAVLVGSTGIFMRSSAADGAAAVAVYSQSANAWSNATAKLHVFRNASTDKASVYADGKIEALSFVAVQHLDDISGTPGDGSTTGMRGKFALDVAESSITITNPNVTIHSVVLVVPEDGNSPAEHAIVCSAGSFTMDYSFGGGGGSGYTGICNFVII